MAQGLKPVLLYDVTQPNLLKLQLRYTRLQVVSGTLAGLINPPNKSCSKETGGHANTSKYDEQKCARKLVKARVAN